MSLAHRLPIRNTLYRCPPSLHSPWWAADAQQGIFILLGSKRLSREPHPPPIPRSTSPGWPFSLPKALFFHGFLRKAADFESHPATLSCPGFLSDSAIPLCFREGGHAAKSGSPRHTLPGDTGAWTRAPMKPSARAVFGVAGCRWRCSSTPGTPPIATVSRPSVMAPKAARSTRQAPPERYRVARA